MEFNIIKQTKNGAETSTIFEIGGRVYKLTRIVSGGKTLSLELHFLSDKSWRTLTQRTLTATRAKLGKLFEETLL